MLPYELSTVIVILQIHNDKINIVLFSFLLVQLNNMKIIIKSMLPLHLKIFK